MRLGDDNELLVRGGVVFGGYWRNEEATKDAFTDGWFHTGDLGAIDADGFLTIIGRKKEIIVTAGGKNVAPAVLEDRLRAHPLISQAMAVGDAQPFIAPDHHRPGGLRRLETPQRQGLRGHGGRSGRGPDLVNEVELAVKEANEAVSRPSDPHLPDPAGGLSPRTP
jgi:long-chain acyl-CoA synthetase